MNPETLKEYLVSIGWDINESDYRHASDVIKKFGSQIAEKISPNVKTLGNAALFVLDVLKTGNKIIAQTISTVADLDYETEKLARQWWVSEEAARSYSTALDALGETNEDLLTMTDEQYRRLVELNQVGRSLEAPKELEDFLLTVRDIKFEFSKLKVEIQYGFRWVTYFFAKMNGTDAKNIRETLKSFNEKIQKNLPVIAKKIAEILNVFYRLGKAAIAIGKTLFNLIKSIFEIFDNKLGKTAGLITSFFLLLKSGPIGWFIAALTTLLLLVEDYMGYKEGKISFFDWGAIDEQFGDIGKDLSDIKDDLSEIFDFISDIFDELGANEVILETFKQIVSTIRSLTSLIADDFDRIAKVIDAIKNLDVSKLFEDFDLGEWAENRTGDLQDFFGNPIVEKVVPGASNVADLAGLANAVIGKFRGGMSNLSKSVDSVLAGAASSVTSSAIVQKALNTVNYGGVNVNVNSTTEANDFLNMFTQRDFSTPIK